MILKSCQQNTAAAAASKQQLLKLYGKAWVSIAE